MRKLLSCLAFAVLISVASPAASQATAGPTASRSSKAPSKPKTAPQPESVVPRPDSGPPTVAEAQRFMQQVEARLNDLGVKGSRSEWVAENFITDDTQAI